MRSPRPKGVSIKDIGNGVRGTYTNKHSGIVHAIVGKRMTIPWTTHTQYITYFDSLCSNAVWFPWRTPIITSRTYNAKGKTEDVTCKGCLRSLRARQLQSYYRHLDHSHI
jgi:hypothetical protein